MNKKTKILKRKEIVRNISISMIFIAISIIIGLLFNDFFIGGILLALNLIYTYLAGNGRKSYYFFSIASSLLWGYISLINHYYGTALMSFFILIPIDIYGFFSWSKKMDPDNVVEERRFKPKTSFVVVLICILVSIFIGFLLSLIPGQVHVLLDASTDCLGICSLILLALRFEEGWYVFIMHDLVDIFIWILSIQEGGPDAVMSLITCIALLFLDIYSIRKWQKHSKIFHKKHHRMPSRRIVQKI